MYNYEQVVNNYTVVVNVCRHVMCVRLCPSVSCSVVTCVWSCLGVFMGDFTACLEAEGLVV